MENTLYFFKSIAVSVHATTAQPQTIPNKTHAITGYLGIIATSTHERAEDVGKNPEFREQYDFATARAVAPLNVLCEYCMPLVKVGGRFVSLKGSNGLEELEAAKNAIMVLGGEIEAAESYVLPNGDGRTIFVIKKISQTPTKYPRKPKKIDTRPL